MYSNTPNAPRVSSQGFFHGAGVHQGGNISRPRPMHMGTTSVLKGGRNAKGSQHNPGLRPVKSTSTLTSFLGRANTARHPVPTPVAARPTPAPYVAPTLGNLSTHDSIYDQSVGNAKYDYDMSGNDIVPLNAQLNAMPAQWKQNLYDLDKNNRLTQEQSNAQLAARGVYDSGGRVNADVGIKHDYDNSYTDLRNTYGDLAQKQLGGQITGLEDARLRAQTLAVQGAEQDALGRYNEAHPEPSAPIVPAGAGVSNAKPPPAGKSYKSGFFKNGAGTWYFVNAAGQMAPAAAGKTIQPGQMVDAPWVQNKGWK